MSLSLWLKIDHTNREVRIKLTHWNANLVFWTVFVIVFQNTLFLLMSSIAVKMALSIKIFVTSCLQSIGTNRTIRDVPFANYGNKKRRLAISANRRLFFESLSHATAMSLHYPPLSHPVRESPLRRAGSIFSADVKPRRSERRADKVAWFWRATSGQDDLAL